MFDLHLLFVGMVGTTIIPETVKFTTTNKVGMYPCPISVTLGDHGELFILCGEEKQRKIYQIRLHNPITSITPVKSPPIIGNHIAYYDGTLLFCGSDGSIQLHQVKEKRSVLKCKSKKDLVDLAATYGLYLDHNNSLKSLGGQCQAYLTNKENEYNSEGTCLYIRYFCDHVLLCLKNSTARLFLFLHY